MINFNHYPDDAFELYKKAVERKTDTEGKACLKEIENEVERAYGDYQEAFDDRSVHLLNPRNSISATDKELLLGLYGSDKKVVKGIRAWIDSHNKRTYLRKCPYCAIAPANTTEHILPKEKYPEYAINALNLLPCCSTCNSKKGENVRDDNDKPYIINYYYDRLPNEQYLFVDVSIDAHDCPNFDYRLDNPNGIIDTDKFELIQRHFEKLGLLSRYKTEAINHYAEIENSILEDLEGGDAIDECLIKLRNTAMRDAVEYGRSHWKVVLKLALADSGEYKEFLKGVIWE